MDEMEERSFAMPKAPVMNELNSANMGGMRPQRPVNQQPVQRTAVAPTQPITRNATPVSAARTITNTISKIDKQAKKTYEDLLEMEDKNIYELIEGDLVNIKAPSMKHQMMVGELFAQVYSYVREKKYKVFVSPIDVRVDGSEKDDRKVYNVFQPDLVLVKTMDNVDEYGIKGAPELVIEVTTEDTIINDKLKKFKVYQRYGVKEYWIISIAEKMIEKYVLMSERKYSIERYYINEEVTSDVCKGLKISLEEFSKENENIFGIIEESKNSTKTGKKRVKA